ncbi:EF-hand domain-containing protein [Solilutibacter silvestris]|uniref:EF-hand domain-containing protein n=1 Tax=Solilutibacter silvestris TaxID=1645665 RepID=A0A2K1Q3X1_9GAMM|nr:EF-hand domain-containing protein [Lysobacter silvestris]PNS09724.1 EF-hand domain-containing protein [Lysobacter silvestris]
MKSSTPLVVTLACALGAAAVTAIAQQMPSDPPAAAAQGTPPPAHPDFQAMRSKHAQERFAEMDTNHDGKVSKEEMLAYMAKKDAERAQKRSQFVDEMFKRLDTNGDGALTQDELAKAHGPDGGAWGGHKGQRPHTEMKPAQ